jgi:hypothetical protein
VDQGVTTSNKRADHGPCVSSPGHLTKGYARVVHWKGLGVAAPRASQAIEWAVRLTNLPLATPVQPRHNLAALGVCVRLTEIWLPQVEGSTSEHRKVTRRAREVEVEHLLVVSHVQFTKWDEPPLAGRVVKARMSPKFEKHIEAVGMR